MSVRALRWVCPVLLVFVLSGVALAADDVGPAVSVFDTRAGSSAPLPSAVLDNRPAWNRIAEDVTTHRFGGDAVLLNQRLAIVIREDAPGAELYGRGDKAFRLRAVLSPIAAGPAGRIASRSLVENTAGQAAIDATWSLADGMQARLRFELQAGQPFVKTQGRDGAQRLRVQAPCRLAVLPDFFADDIVVDATELPPQRVELPGENFLMHLVGHDEAIVLAAWSQRDEDIAVALDGQGRDRRIVASEIPYGAKGDVSVVVLEGPGIWHSHEVRKADTDQIIPLRWKAPFPAQWRMDWRQDDGLTDSWEMIVQQPDGTYAKLDWFGQPDAHGTPDWMKPDRKRWTTVLGTFQYPCWIDQQGQGFLQPLRRPGKFLGPAVLYPINRVPATPLTAFTFVDLMRATLGVGPCQYVLDVEGQKKRAEGIATCAARTKLDTIYANKQQKAQRAEVEQALVDVLAFVRHIRTRIEAYAAFGRQTLAYLADQRKAQPELAGFFSEMEMLAQRIEAEVSKRREAIQTPDYATQLVDQFRTTLVGYEGDDALKKCKKITAGLVRIGGNQDELVGQCRVCVRVLRQRAALAMAVDPRTAPVAKELRRRCQEMLRSPTSYEAPRH